MPGATEKTRIDCVGEIHRHHHIKYPYYRNPLARMLSMSLIDSRHKDGTLPKKYYYAEWAGVKFEAGALEGFVKNHWTFFRFGKRGIAMKKHWDHIADKSIVRVVADVIPYQNRLGGYMTRLLKLEHVAVNMETYKQSQWGSDECDGAQDAGA